MPSLTGERSGGALRGGERCLSKTTQSAAIAGMKFALRSNEALTVRAQKSGHEFRRLPKVLLLRAVLLARRRKKRRCTNQGVGAVAPAPAVVQATQTEIGRPSSSIRLSAWTATSTSVARRRSVRERSPSPITCLNLPMAASARARLV